MACSTVAVDISKSPSALATPLRGINYALLIDGVPYPIADEVRSFFSPAQRSTEHPADGAAECHAFGDERVFVRALLARNGFASNTRDRNTLFIYETAIVVGIPVTLISAIVWRYWGETILEVQLEVLDCADGSTDHYTEAHRVRSEGRGFIKTATLRDAQFDAAARSATRALLVKAFRANKEAR